MRYVPRSLTVFLLLFKSWIAQQRSCKSHGGIRTDHRTRRWSCNAAQCGKHRKFKDVVADNPSSLPTTQGTSKRIYEFLETEGRGNNLKRNNSYCLRIKMKSLKTNIMFKSLGAAQTEIKIMPMPLILMFFSFFAHACLYTCIIKWYLLFQSRFAHQPTVRCNNNTWVISYLFYCHVFRFRCLFRIVEMEIKWKEMLYY